MIKRIKISLTLLMLGKILTLFLFACGRKSGDI